MSTTSRFDQYRDTLEAWAAWWNNVGRYTELRASLMNGLSVANDLAAEHRLMASVLADADKLVSAAHDIVWAAYDEWEGEDGRREALNKALWDLHNLLRPVIGEPNV